MTLKQDREKVTKFFERHFKENPGMNAICLPDEIQMIMDYRGIHLGSNQPQDSVGPQFIFFPEKVPVGAPVGRYEEKYKKKYGEPPPSPYDRRNQSEKITIKAPTLPPKHDKPPEPSEEKIVVSLPEEKQEPYIVPDPSVKPVKCRATYIFKGYNLKCCKKHRHTGYHVGEFTDAKGQKHAQSWGSLWDPETVTGQMQGR